MQRLISLLRQPREDPAGGEELYPADSPQPEYVQELLRYLRTQKRIVHSGRIAIADRRATHGFNPKRPTVLR